MVGIVPSVYPGAATPIRSTCQTWRPSRRSTTSIGLDDGRGGSHIEPCPFGFLKLLHQSQSCSQMTDSFDQEAERRFIAAVLLGQQEAVAIFDERMRCVPRIMAALNARRGRPFREADLDDLAQDTFVIAWRKLPAFKPFVPLEGWLYRLFCNEFMNAWRRLERNRRFTQATEDIDEFEGAMTKPSPDDDIHLALERLGGVEAETISLKHFDGLTFAEIAERMAVVEGTVKTRYYRGLVRLERLLEHLDENGGEES